MIFLDWKDFTLKYLEHQPNKFLDFSGYKVSQKCLAATEDLLKAFGKLELWAMKSKLLKKLNRSKMVILIALIQW